MWLVDTNILVYAANRATPEHARCLDLVENLRRSTGPWYTTWGILYEFLRVVTAPRILPRPWLLGEAWGFVTSLLLSPSLRILLETAHHAEVAEQVIRALPGLSGRLAHDLHTAVLMREHGVVRIYTRDTDFHRFPFLEVLDPVVSESR
jgi:toxin-antitoxin system PIN domain toxin